MSDLITPARANQGTPKPEGIDELLLPYVPANVKVDGVYKSESITSDVYKIAERLKELDTPNPITIEVTSDTRHPDARAFTIVEQRPGHSAVLFRTRKLDARVIEYVQYLLRVPFEERYKEAEKLMDKWEAEDKERESDDLVERIGLPMLRDLRECGFLGEYGHGTNEDAARSRKRFGAR